MDELTVEQKAKMWDYVSARWTHLDRKFNRDGTHKSVVLTLKTRRNGVQGTSPLLRTAVCEMMNEERGP